MTFTLLGPVTAQDEDGPLPVGGPRSRTVLAALVLAAGSMVTVERLVDLVWGVRPPHTARRQVQNRVSTLRLAGVPVETCPSGYRLRADCTNSDVAAFEKAARDVHRQLGHGFPDAAAMSARRALALWRGPALAGVNLPRQAALLEELRLDVLTARVDADLALGRHGSVVVELAALTMQHPLRERFVGQLMTALVHSGRRSEALVAYDSARVLLRQQFGVEPGPQLRRLRADVLSETLASTG